MKTYFFSNTRFRVYGRVFVFPPIIDGAEAFRTQLTSYFQAFSSLKHFTPTAE